MVATKAPECAATKRRVLNAFCVAAVSLSSPLLQAGGGDVGIDPDQRDRHAVSVLEMHRRLVDVFDDGPPRIPSVSSGQSPRQANGSFSGAPRWRAIAASRDCSVPAPSVAKYSTAPLRLMRYCPANGCPVITETDRSSAAVVLKDPHWPDMMPTPVSGSNCFTSQRIGLISVLS